MKSDPPALISSATVTDHHGEKRIVNVVGEVPLTLVVNGEELVTLMTLGEYPKELAIGYLCNQHLIDSLAEIKKVEVDWNREHVKVTTRGTSYKQRIRNAGRRTVTSGCGQGSIFDSSLDRLYETRLPERTLKRSVLFELLHRISKRETVYKQAGALHACALCNETQTIFFVEDVGRHNAADIIAGMMRQKRMTGNNKIFYTTGRLTSEIVMKVAHIGVPILLSRSGVTNMGLELARDLNMVMIARAKAASFLVYNKPEAVIHETRPTTAATAGARRYN